MRRAKHWVCCRTPSSEALKSNTGIISFTGPRVIFCKKTEDLPRQLWNSFVIAFETKYKMRPNRQMKKKSGTS